MGEIISLCTFRIATLPTGYLLLFCLIMLLDWMIQFLNIQESTNFRRLITGTLCGYSFITIALKILLLIKEYSVTM